MRRKIDLTELKYSFRSWYLHNCMKQCVSPRFSDLATSVARECEGHSARIQKLMLARKGDTTTASKAELAAFSRVLNIAEDLLAEAAVPGERVVTP